MKIAACYKIVPFSEEIEVRRDRTLDCSKASLEIGQYDLRAVETAMRLKEAAGEGTVLALTVGGETVSNSKMKKAVLARGPAEMYGVQDASLTNADTLSTAACLKAAVEKMGDVDLGFMSYRVEFWDQGKPLNDNWEHPKFSDQADTVYYRPHMVRGVIDVKKYREGMKC